MIYAQAVHSTHVRYDVSFVLSTEMLPWWVFLVMIVCFIFLQYLVRCCIKEYCCKNKRQNQIIASTNARNDDDLESSPETVEAADAPPAYTEVISDKDKIYLPCIISDELPPPSYEAALAYDSMRDQQIVDETRTERVIYTLPDMTSLNEGNI